MIKVQLDDVESYCAKDIAVDPNDYRLYLATDSGHILAFEEDADHSIHRVNKVRVCKHSIRRIMKLGDGLLVADTEGSLFWSSSEATEEDAAVEIKVSGAGGDENVVLGPVSAMVSHQYNGTIYVGNESGDVFICKLSTKEKLLTVEQKFDHHDDYISCLVVVPQKKTLLVGSGDGTMSVIDLKRKKVVASTKNHEEDVTALALLSAEGRDRVILGTSLGTLKLFEWNYWGDPVDTWAASYG